MVQLAPSPVPCLSPTDQADEKKMAVKTKKQGSPKSEAHLALTSLQVAVAASTTTYQGYDTYIEDGLVSLKHKIRNIEKKKIKLEVYRQRRQEGELLNQDQLEAVEKYDEVIHNLAFAKELQKTFSSLSQDLLKAQKKAVRREQVLKIETEKRRLRTILQVQYILQNLQEEHVRKDFHSGLNGAPFLSASELDYLLKFSKLASLMRDEQMSLEDQMEQATSYLWELLEGGEKVVVGTTYKHLKAQMAKMMDCGYFDHIPVPQSKMLEEVEEVHKVVEEKTEPLRKLPKEGTKELVKVLGEPSVQFIQTREVQLREFNRRYLPETDFHSQVKTKTLQPWKADFAAMKQEPPDSWEMQFDDSRTTSPQPVPTKQGRAAAEHVAKEQVESKMTTTSPKKKREQKPKTGEEVKPVPKPIHSPIAVFNSTSSLPKDPALRRQKIQDLMAQIQGSFSFMQDSVLDCESSPVSAMPLLAPLSVLPSSTPIAPRESKQKIQADLLPQALQTAPSADRSPSTSLNGDRSLNGPEIDFASAAAQETISALPEAKSFVSPPAIYQTASIPAPLVEKGMDQTRVPLPCEQQMPLCNTMSAPELQTQAFQSPPTSNHTLSMSAAPFQAMHTIFKVNAPLPPRDMKPETSSYSESYNQSCSTASTQTTLQCSSQPAYTLDQNTIPHETLQPGKTNAFLICWSVCGGVMNLGFCFNIHKGFINGVFWCLTFTCCFACFISPPPLSTVTTYQSECPVSNGCQVYMSPGQQNAFPRSNQAYYNNRGTIRGTPRGSRGLANSYRSPSGYKAGFDGYRGGMQSPGGNYTHQLYPAREYTTMLYGSREAGFQQNYKRGGPAGQKTNSRAGWSDSSQVSSPERDHETFNSVDSGHGGSRCITPIDIPVTSQATTLMPVHVYPLPPQMRVAFSAARTSNFAPGTLDQTIAFDLLLNNLGETFEMHMGRFSCPANGTYVFIFHMLKLAVNVPLYVNLMKNEEVLVSAYANDGAPDHETASNHAVLQLYQGDQIWLRLHRGAIYGSSWKYSTFSGYLLYQD
ncbi:caprin-2-like [Polyodon spathula]|uniref:caprin-2-like n=1 Tax=Polyodon spathula TaxID=7913 RepID=UPI001B7ED27D|nr:caprin-2-like [Polyodon spathula]